MHSIGPLQDLQGYRWEYVLQGPCGGKTGWALSESSLTRYGGLCLQGLLDDSPLGLELVHGPIGAHS